ncbi:MAG TPA: curli-like amyloid fiber formation chaperone CsgH [Vitreimonas sp.]|uniref:curli-like amyloid fiber formation chaperone CsgH n=1 Tax=Vitreimonas sp. TaxID=3069702 RepID=UPI002D73D39F|nr:curli-like amyloid fiber formation chaperone CsgH [Vitreimonas sp.]HYD87566.1 curli-like amyloid fiber formation chaperone CsgH [Vitreimonas sp.]
MSRHAMLAALLLSVAACAAASEPPETAAELDAPAIAYEPAESGGAAPAYRTMPAELGCEIDVTRISGGVRLEARAINYSIASDSLEYDFVVTKSGAAGSSDIVQGGEVTEEAVGEVELSLERGARYRARLTLSDTEGEVCTTRVRS